MSETNQETAQAPASSRGLRKERIGQVVSTKMQKTAVVETTTRVPQEERTRAMRQRLLEACVECLVERGWSGTSTTLVSQRAGVSRGADAGVAAATWKDGSGPAPPSSVTGGWSRVPAPVTRRTDGGA